MTRTLSPAYRAQLDEGTVRPIMFFEGVFAAGTVRLWTGVGEVTWNGVPWVGAGQLLGISTISETADLRASGMTVTLSGISSSVIALVLDQARLGLPGRVWFGFTDAAGVIVADPYLAFEGKLDVPSISDDGTQCTVSIAYENHLIDLERPRLFRWTHEQQQALHPGSMGFEYVAGLADKQIIF
jgi:hypothetical protein